VPAGNPSWRAISGVSLIALVMVHVYFAVRPEKLAITKSMRMTLAAAGGVWLDFVDI